MPGKAAAAINRKKKLQEQTIQTGMDETQQFLNTNPKINTEFSPAIANQMELSGIPVAPEKISKTKTGEFSPEKGGFVTETGQTFPTKNPEFKPSEQGLTTEIKFNQDGSINYTPKGSLEPIKLSKEEYKGLLGKEGGFVTEKVKQIQASEQPAPNIDLLTQEQISSQVGGVDLSKGAVGGAIQGAAVAVEKLSSFLPEFLRFGTKKSLDVTKAEQGFADYSNVLDNQIALFRQGLIPASQVERTFSLAEQEIIRLQSQTKNLGQVDLRFWLDKGAEIEAQVAREIAILQNKKASLGLL